MGPLGAGLVRRKNVCQFFAKEFDAAKAKGHSPSRYINTHSA